MMKHCATCECDDSSSLGGLNTRIKALFYSGEPLLKVHPAIAERLVTNSAMYQFGFREYIPSQGSMQLVASILVGLRDPEAYYVQLLGGPWTFQEPIKYPKGGCWDISKIDFHKEDLLYLLDKITDSELAAWLKINLEILHDFVKKDIGVTQESTSLIDGYF